MTSTSGRAGLFTIDNGRYFGDLRGTPYTNDNRQKSGAIRLEFGQYMVPNGASLGASVKTTCLVGIMAVVTPDKVPTITNAGATKSGAWVFATGGFHSGYIPITYSVTGEYSGQHSGLNINYMVVGY